MDRGFNGRERRAQPGADAGSPALDEGGIRIDAASVTTARAEVSIDQIVAVSRVLSRPLWGPLALSALGTFNLIVGVETGALRDYVPAAIMLAAGAMWRVRGTRHILVLNVGGTEDAPWATRDGALMGRVVSLIEERVAAIRGG